MAANSDVNKNGFIWLCVAGLVAVSLSFFLYKADNHLSFSDKEHKLGETLRELRSAQGAVSGGVSDSRQVPSIAVSQVQDVEDDHGHASDDPHH